MSDKKYMDIKEFREEGYLQELNRNFLHPLGLAIEVVILADGTERFGQVWDSRDDPEGIIFGAGVIEQAKVDNVHKQMVEKTMQRLKGIGFVVQPVDDQTLP